MHESEDVAMRKRKFTDLSPRNKKTETPKKEKR
jgi:hypothetical protein